MAPGSLAWKIIGARGSLGGKDAQRARKKRRLDRGGMAHSSPRANAATSPPPVHLPSNEDSQNSVLSSRFASRQGTMDTECEDGQLKDVQRLMEERREQVWVCRAH